MFISFHSMDKNNIIDLLKSHGQKITPTRLWIIDQLGQAKKPLNPYELLDLDPEATIDITTIYRNLELFETL